MSYATLAEARDAGITTDAYGSTLAADARVQRLLDEASEYVDRATGWWFEPRAKTLRLDGDGTQYLWLPAPIVSLTSVTVGDTTVEVPAGVVQYGLVADQDKDMRAARLELAGGQSIYSLARPQPPLPVWPLGRKNVEVVGSFGYTKANGTSPPSEIRDAVLRLALREINQVASAASADERRRAGVYREATDGHSYEAAGGMPGSAGSWRFGGLTGDPWIDTVVARYRRPSRAARV